MAKQQKPIKKLTKETKPNQKKNLNSKEVSSHSEIEDDLRLFSLAVEISLDGIVIGDISGKITYVNNALLKMYSGLAKSEFQGKHVLDFMVERDRARAIQNATESIKTGEGKRDEFTVRTKKGEEVLVEVTTAVIKNEKGEGIGFIDIIRDVTERKQMQEKLEAYSKRLEDLVEERTKQLGDVERFAAIGELAGMVGHDLRNPLASIKNAAYFLRKKQADFIGESGDEMLSVIDRSVEHANRIVNDLLDYSRELHLELEEYSPKSLIDYLLLTIKVPSNIKLSAHAQDFPSLWVDQNKIERVFINLVNNAFEAMPNGGTFEINACQKGETIEFTFADTGTGMSRETLAKIFTPLFTTKAQGMGFGLAICKRIVDAHEGNITVESVLRKGTTFTVSLPIMQKQIGFKKCPS